MGMHFVNRKESNFGLNRGLKRTKSECKKESYRRFVKKEILKRVLCMVKLAKIGMNLSK